MSHFIKLDYVAIDSWAYFIHVTYATDSTNNIPNNLLKRQIEGWSSNFQKLHLMLTDRKKKKMSPFNPPISPLSEDGRLIGQTGQVYPGRTVKLLVRNLKMKWEKIPQP